MTTQAEPIAGRRQQNDFHYYIINRRRNNRIVIIAGPFPTYEAAAAERETAVRAFLRQHPINQPIIDAILSRPVTHPLKVGHSYELKLAPGSSAVASVEEIP